MPSSIILETAAWSPQQHHFYAVTEGGRHGFGSADTYVLYFDAARNPDHIRGALDFISDPAYWKTINIEEESYVPLVLFRYGRAEVAWRVLLDLSAPVKARREYPEVSYAVIAALISGAMGIEPAREGDAFDVQSLPQPLSQTDTMTVTSLHIRSNTLDVSHTGDARTVVVNKSGPSIRWKAAFAGSRQQLKLNGTWQRAEHGISLSGMPVSWVIVPVPAGGTITVSTEK